VSELDKSAMALKQINYRVDEAFTNLTGSSLISEYKIDHCDVVGSAEKVIHYINTNFDMLVDSLRRRQTQLIEEVNALSAAKSDMLRSQMDNISHQLSRNHSVCSATRQHIQEESKSWLVDHVDELIESMTNQLQSDATVDRAVITSSDIQYKVVSPDCMSRFGSIYDAPTDEYLSTLYSEARCTGNKHAIDELLHVVHNNNNAVARAFYSVLLYTGLKVNRKNLIIDKLEASNIMSELMQNFLIEATKVNCSSSVQLILGLVHYHGISINEDKFEAFRYYKLSADQGNAVAQNILGYCYASGNGVGLDKSEAFRYYKMSADQGSNISQNIVGYCYASGNGVEVDKAQAFRYYKMSADQGNAVAQNNVASCYYYGDGVHVDHSQAFRYYKMSANQGDTNAKNNIRFCDNSHVVVNAEETERPSIWHKSGFRKLFNFGRINKK
jgi:hypothetical protein